jgi:signal transduction histidine kinase
MEDNAELTRMLGRTAHNMRTPLTSIVGFAELIMEDADASEQIKEHASIVGDEAKKLADMLEESFIVMRRLADGGRANVD